MRTVCPLLLVLLTVSPFTGNGLFGMESGGEEAGAGPLLSFEISVELDDAGRMLLGREDLVWTNRTQDAVPDMLFHLYYNAFKNEKSTVMQEALDESLFNLVPGKEGEWGWLDVSRIEMAGGPDLTPTMEYLAQDDPSHKEDRTVMRIQFPEPVRPGESVRLKIEFQAKIPRAGLRSGYYGRSYFISQWFPKPGVYEEGQGWNCHEYHLTSEFFADFADFTVHVTVPNDLIVGASGNLTGFDSNKTAGKTTYTYAQAMIHDFAWTASPEFIKVEKTFVASDEVTSKEYEAAAAQLGLSPEDVKLPDVKMILLIGKQHRNQIDRHFRALKTAIKYYGLWYGPYPYETVTMVDPPFRTGSGGMEYPTLFTAGTSLLPSRKVLSPEGVIIHEFGHGYWYGLVANNEFEEAWLDEGINTYATGKVLAKAYGSGEIGFSFKGIPLNGFIDFPVYYDYEFDRAIAINIVKYDPVVTPSWKFSSSGSYAANTYMRASICLNTLERLIGSEPMARIMRTFQTRFRFKHPKTRDFIETVNEISGRDMTWFFKELFFETLNFDYGVDSLRSVEKPRYARGVFETEGKKTEITSEKIKTLAASDISPKTPKTILTTVILRRFGEARVNDDTPLKVKVVFEDGSEEIRYWDGQERWTRLTFEKPSKAREALIDPDGIWLIDSNLANNSRRVKAARGGFFRLTAKTLFLLQILLQSVSSLS